MFSDKNCFKNRKQFIERMLWYLYHIKQYFVLWSCLLFFKSNASSLCLFLKVFIVKVFLCCSLNNRTPLKTYGWEHAESRVQQYYVSFYALKSILIQVSNHTLLSIFVIVSFRIYLSIMEIDISILTSLNLRLRNTLSYIF